MLREDRGVRGENPYELSAFSALSAVRFSATPPNTKEPRSVKNLESSSWNERTYNVASQRGRVDEILRKMPLSSS
jgi:hypothetical protein